MPSSRRTVERAPSAAIANAPDHTRPSSPVSRTSVSPVLTPVTRAPHTNSTPASVQAARRNRSVSVWRRLVKGGGPDGGGNVREYTSRPR
ncbi:hypothetical protein SVIOM74S_06509 [Streptomyces violarus]